MGEFLTPAEYVERLQHLLPYQYKGKVKVRLHHDDEGRTECPFNVVVESPPCPGGTTARAGWIVNKCDCRFDDMQHQMSETLCELLDLVCETWTSGAVPTAAAVA